MALTKRQKQVLDFIAHFVEDNGYCPSYDEIAHGLNLASLATVHKHISALTSKNYLKRGFNQSRSLELAPKYLQEQRRSKRTLEIPMAGRIAAGPPVEGVERRETLDLGELAADGNSFALEVRGDSMIEECIRDGDIAILSPASEIHDGEIAAALVAGSETTLKRVFREAGGMVRLQPANSSMLPITVRASDVQIQGRLLAVLRRYR